ncbi:glycosyltransferase family 4 protein [Aquiflexum sp.]|uniref:glycosyltransferase family 4 protein n=1 Tax=Aquiflexum sp. TaxID=1872584 RepID=UPI00359307D4
MERVKKRVLIHSIVFSPDGVSTAYIYNDIALKLHSEGLEVIVLTTTPHYNRVDEELNKQILIKKFGGLFYQSSYNGIKVYHVPQKKFKSIFLRGLGMVYWHFVSMFISIFLKRINVVISPSPPLTIGVISILIAKIKGAKSIYNVQEIYPDLYFRQENLKFKPLVNFLKWLEKWIYNNSDSIITIDEVFYNKIADRIDQTEKLKIIPNFVDTDLYFPIVPKDLDQTIFPDKTNTLKLMYAGNIGHAQHWEPLLEVSKKCQDIPVEFWVVGEGVLKIWLVEKVNEMNLTNVHIVDYQPRYLMPQLIAYADLHFIFMEPTLQYEGFPSKVYTILACQKSLLVLSGTNTPLSNFLLETNTSFLITEQEKVKKSNEVFVLLKELLTNKDKLIEMGRNGFELVNKKYSKKIITNKYSELIKSI